MQVQEERAAAAAAVEVPVRIACLQLEPVFKNPAESIKRADRLLELEPGSIDLLVLPEMAFTGYCFKDREDIAPYVEEVPAGKTSKWAMRTARKFGCYIQVGVPTLEPLRSSPDDNDNDKHGGRLPRDGPTVQDLYYNSTVLVDPRGRVKLVYHKRFLFETDQTWATPGDGFVSINLSFPASSTTTTTTTTKDTTTTTTYEVRYSPAICMDLNAEAFDSRLEKFEYSNFVKRRGVGLVVASNAWLDSDESRGQALDDGRGRGGVKPSDANDPDATKMRDTLGQAAAAAAATDDDAEGEEADERTSWEQARGLISYWVYRMSTNLEDDDDDGRRARSPGLAFVVCNRIGTEGDAVFAGSSCAIQLGPRPTVVKHASKKKEEIVLARVSVRVAE